MPIRAEPASRMIVRTSAKSRLTRPGTVIRSVMPWTPWRRMSSAIRKASVDRGPLLDDLEQPVVLDHDQRVDPVAEALDALVGLLRALAALEDERPRDDPDRERLELACELGDDRRPAGTGAPALAGGDEDHVGALQRLLQLVAALLRGGLADGRIRSGAEAARLLRADVDLHVGVAHHQRLRVRVDGDELDAAEARVDHPVDGVRAAAADADDLDHSEVVTRLVAHAHRDDT